MDYRIEDQLRRVHERDNWTCQKCGKPSNQAAHRIGKGKVNHKASMRYVMENHPEMTHLKSDDIIHHLLNMVATCSTECNSSYNIGNNIIETNKLIEKILKELRNGKSRA